MMERRLNAHNGAGPQGIDQLDTQVAKLNQYQNTTVLLGFNEPDRYDQAYMTAQAAAQQWYKLERVAARYNLRLASPAVGSVPSWMTSFARVRMRGACTRGSPGTLCPKQQRSTLGEAHAMSGVQLVVGPRMLQPGCLHLAPMPSYLLGRAEPVADAAAAAAAAGL